MRGLRWLAPAICAWRPISLAGQAPTVGLRRERASISRGAIVARSAHRMWCLWQPAAARRTARGAARARRPCERARDMSRQLSFGRRRDSGSPSQGIRRADPATPPWPAAAKAGMSGAAAAAVWFGAALDGVAAVSDGGRQVPALLAAPARRCRRPPTATSDSSARRAATRRRRRRCAPASRAASRPPPSARRRRRRRSARSSASGSARFRSASSARRVPTNLSEAFGVDGGGGALGGAAARPSRDGTALHGELLLLSAMPHRSREIVLWLLELICHEPPRRRRPPPPPPPPPPSHPPSSAADDAGFARRRGAARRGGAPRTGREVGAPQSRRSARAAGTPPLQCFSSDRDTPPPPRRRPHPPRARRARDSPPPPPSLAAAARRRRRLLLLGRRRRPHLSGGVVRRRPPRSPPCRRCSRGAPPEWGGRRSRESGASLWDADRSPSSLMSSARAKRAGEVRGPGPLPPRLLLYRRALRLHIEWEAELPWHAPDGGHARGSAPTRRPAPSCARPLLSVRRGETPSAALARGLPLYGLEAVDVALDHPRRGARRTRAFCYAYPGVAVSRRRGTCARVGGDARPSVRQDAYARRRRARRDRRRLSGGGARGCMRRRWRRRRGRRRARGPRRCGRRRAAAALGRRCSPPKAPLAAAAAVAVARRVAAQSIGRRVVIARHRRLAAGLANGCSPSSPWASPPPPPPSLPAPPSSPAAAVPCVCVGRREEGLPLRLETALGAACARLGHGGGPALSGAGTHWSRPIARGSSARARLLSQGAAHGRIVAARRAPCACPPPAPTVGSRHRLPRASAPRARTALRVVLGERLPVSSPPPTAQAPPRWRGGGRARAAAALSTAAIELSELRKCGWGGGLRARRRRARLFAD